MNSTERRSPVHELLDSLGARWGRLGGTPVALSFGPEDAEAKALRTLGLCDVSTLVKLGIKGPGAESWLRDQQIALPEAIYDALPLADGGRIIRLGAGDFLLESGFPGEVVPCLSGRLDAAAPGVYRVERQDAAFLLTGSRAPEALAQLCSIDFRSAEPRRLLLTRAAGVNCGILPDQMRDIPLYRLWVDCGYAVFFWETLAEVCEEFGGRVVGAAVLAP